MPEAPGETGEHLVPQASDMPCWRCELEVPVGYTVCPHCEATIFHDENEASSDVFAKPPVDAFKVLMWSYALLLASTIVLAIVIDLAIDEDSLFDDAQRFSILVQTLIAEALDTVVVCVAIAMCFRAVRFPRKGSAKIWQSWLIFVPMLTLMLLLNHGYHWLLREFLQVPRLEDALTGKFDALVFLTYCIQPAIVEELYCRGLVLSYLRSVLGRHSAVWISAILFGLLHVGAPFSIPYLILMGVYLGYARIASGSLVLPMLLHFFHNLYVVLT